MLFPEPAQLGFGPKTDTLCLELNMQCEEMAAGEHAMFSGWPAASSSSSGQRLEKRSNAERSRLTRAIE